MDMYINTEVLCLSCICVELLFTMTGLSRFERCMTTLLLSYFLFLNSTIVLEVVIITQLDHFDIA